MVAQSDLMRVGMLNSQLSVIAQALQMAETDFSIVSMTWSNRTFPFNQLTISTAEMAFPPQMVDAIRTNLETQQQQIVDELERLGVTDVETAEGRR